MVTDDSAIGAIRTRESAPMSLWLMAGLALAPFPVSAVVYGFGPETVARPAISVLLTWSAVVLSFLAGVRWGLESGRRVPRRGRLAGAVLFGVVAWGLLLLRWRLELPWTLVAYLAAFMTQWLSDHAAPQTAARFPLLSTAITGAACVSLAVALEHALRS
ncbi:DUF3429 domain-containing protein [Phenylobacterium sp. LjRoot219]|uniref:DUF3429 domain-containing protein n=1 Tax=Phenylobacterium sp. LjRoot219 TaxID=3342283 RepID=UPI003ECE90E3